MTASLARSMLTAVALSLAGLGALGAGLSCWQFFVMMEGVRPVVADVWRHSGLAGELLVRFFDALPSVLAGATVYHLLIAVLGIGLARRRAWARDGGMGLGLFWVASAAVAWAVARYALEDLARADPGRAGFARVAESLAAQVALVNVGVGAALLLLLIQPAVSAQFRSGS